MANNLYGGYLYQNTPFVFDKIYDNYTQMIEDESHPLIGRFVLVKYCKDALTQNILEALKKQVEENISTDTLTYFEQLRYRLHKKCATLLKMKRNGVRDIKQTMTTILNALIENYIKFVIIITPLYMSQLEL